MRIAFSIIIIEVEVGSMVFIKLIVGVILLAFGRKLVWMFIGLIGFVAGLSAAQALMPDQPVWYALAAGAVVGLLLILIANFVKEYRIRSGGIPAGGLSGEWDLDHAQTGSGYPGLDIYPDGRRAGCFLHARRF